MLRVVLVLLAVAVVTVAASLYLPDGRFDDIVAMIAGIDILMLMFVGFIATMHWLTAVSARRDVNRSVACHRDPPDDRR